MNTYNLDDTNVNYFFLEGEITNNAYKLNDSDINILFKDNQIKDLMEQLINRPFQHYVRRLKNIFTALPKTNSFELLL